MQELRLVAVSEDGSYLVLATAGRGTRFTLPVDDRLRAAVRGHFSRLGQFEIEVESPLRPKEIQARIRAGETAEEIAETAGIPVERVRWFEGPVLQEREYMAQQAQRVVVRRPGETSPGPPLGEIVTERLGRRGVDLEEVEWDSWKCEDSTWRVRLSFFLDGRPYAAEWTFDPRRRHVSALDEEAARLSSLDLAAADTVTPLAPRRPAMKIVSFPPDDVPAASGPPRPPAPPAPPARDPRHDAPARAAEPSAPRSDDLEEILAATRDAPPAAAPRPREPRPAEFRPAESGPPEPEPEPETEPEIAASGPVTPAAEHEAATGARPTEPGPAEGRPAASGPAQPRPAAPRPTEARPAEPRPAESHPTESRPAERADDERDAAPAAAAAPAAEHAAAAAGGAVSPAAKSQPAQQGRNRRKSSARGKRASVPSWDEIMFGARRPD
jgi:hypothetical protein